jgi:hypothetical protein
MGFMEFDWDDEKARINQQKHGVTFEEATEVFYDDHAVAFPDEEHSFAEQRFNIIGCSSQNLLFVVYAERHQDIIRIISAREADNEERRIYYEN